MSRRLDTETRTVRAALDSDTAHGAVVPPIHLSSTYSFAGFGERRQYDYSRSGNPTRDALAGALADLEGGAGAVVVGTGMAAVNLVSLLVKPGERIVVPQDCYGGSYRLFAALQRTGRAQV
ncbi:MAG: PLP-dependent transferase, partial [Gammaproteobacteria bacterium]